MRGGQGSAAEELGEATAPGRVELQAAHRARRDELRRIRERPAVLPGGHVGEHLPPDRGQPGQVLAGHRLFEPGHAVAGQPVRDADGLAHGVAAVGVHVQFGVLADHLAGERYPLDVPALVATPALAILIFTRGMWSRSTHPAS